MKLRVPGDPRFPGFRDARLPVRVTRDGVPIRHVVAVDTATGVAWRCVKDADGWYVVDRATELVVLERITGSFRIEQGVRA